MLSNAAKVWLFIIISSLSLLVLGYTLGDRLGLMLGFFAATILNAVVFWFGEIKVLSELEAYEHKGQDAWGVADIIQDFANRLQVKAPRFFLIDSNHVTALSFGLMWKQNYICISSELLSRFSNEELRAVIAHQLCHIKRLDSFGFAVTSTLANGIVGLGNILDLFWPLNFLNLERPHTPFSTLLTPVGWFIIRLVVDQKVYMENDEMASDLIGNRHLMAEVLWKLDGMSMANPLDVPPCTSHLFIVNPEGGTRRNFGFESHPKIRKRLHKLLGYFPL